MNFEDLRNLWKQESVSAVGIAGDELWAEVRKDSHKFSRMIFWRDLREIAASLVVAFVFGKVAWDAYLEGDPSLPAWIAAVIPLLVGVFFMVDRIYMRMNSKPKGESLLIELDRSIREVNHQIWLLRNVWWWYIIPLSISSFLLGLQIVLYGPETMPVFVKWIVGALVLLPIGFVDWWVWKLNQKAVEKELNPRLEQLQEKRDSLNEYAR